MFAGCIHDPAVFLLRSPRGEDLPWEMKLPFKEATIHYELTGSEQGKETLYIKDYGKLRAKHHQSHRHHDGNDQKDGNR